MALKRMALELGMGTDIQGGDYTKAATRAVQNALRQNALVVADAFDLPRDAMQVNILIGVQKPDEVDTEAIAALLPYGSATVSVETGGMDTPNEAGTNTTIMANAALVVYLDLPEGKSYGVPA
ncbi:MAG: Lin0512 family protein [Hyphomicrobiales bacterium]